MGENEALIILFAQRNLLLVYLLLQEYFLPFFSAAGYPCYAISLRGQGNSERGDLKVLIL